MAPLSVSSFSCHLAQPKAPMLANTSSLGISRHILRTSSSRAATQKTLLWDLAKRVERLSNLTRRTLDTLSVIPHRPPTTGALRKALAILEDTSAPELALVSQDTVLMSVLLMTILVARRTLILVEFVKNNGTGTITTSGRG